MAVFAADAVHGVKRMASWKILEGNCLQALAALPQKHFHCVVTSPPYFGLRSYLGKDDPSKTQEIGSEQTPAEYVGHMIEVARGVRRVLRNDGTFWLNVGDSYAGSGAGGGGGSIQETNRRSAAMPGCRRRVEGHATKSLCLVPERLAIALADDGWVVRSKIRWFKVSPMPEPCRDRPTSAVEEIFLLTKQGKYFYDAVSVRANDNMTRNLWNWWEVVAEGSGSWFMATESLKDDHYAVFPSKLPERCIRLGTSERGCCPECGSPWQRIVERKKLKRQRPNEFTKRRREEGTGNACANTMAGVATETLGWEAGCQCGHEEVESCRVLDPFSGAATTLLAALRLGRDSVGIELNPQYVELSRRRLLADNPLFNGMKEARE